SGCRRCARGSGHGSPRHPGFGGGIWQACLHEHERGGLERLGAPRYNPAGSRLGLSPCEPSPAITFSFSKKARRLVFSVKSGFPGSITVLCVRCSRLTPRPAQVIQLSCGIRVKISSHNPWLLV